MKRSFSDDNLTKLDNKKRKRSLTIKPVIFLKCDICHEYIKNYGQCIAAFVFCSEECLDVLCLRELNNVGRDSFEDDPMKFDE